MVQEHCCSKNRAVDVMYDSKHYDWFENIGHHTRARTHTHTHTLCTYSITVQPIVWLLTLQGVSNCGFCVSLPNIHHWEHVHGCVQLSVISSSLRDEKFGFYNWYCLAVAMSRSM